MPLIEIFVALRTIVAIPYTSCIALFANNRV